MFVWALLLVLLFSLSIGIVGGKPGKVPPGKPPSPPPEPETADFEIWIGAGSGAQDISLNSPSPLYVGDVAYSGGHWTLPTKIKRRDTIEWGVQLLGWEGDDCGTYNIAEVYCDCCETPEKLTDALSRFGIENGDGAYEFGIMHACRVREKADYWKLYISWDLSEPGGSYHTIGFVGDTNKDLMAEGTYNEDLDTWTVGFNEVRFSVYEIPVATGPEDYEWTGLLSFTVEIRRILPD